MNAPIRTSALVPVSTQVSFTPNEMALIRRTCAKDATDDEFNVFIKTALALRLNPLRKQIYCFIYNKDDPKKRQMTIVTAISGFRAIADRTGNYRPDDQAPVFTILPWKVSRDAALIEMRAEAAKLPIKDRKDYLSETTVAIDDLYPVDPINPEGIEKVEVRVFKFAHGSWHTVTAEAYWSEYAPIKDEWSDQTGSWRKTGRQYLDTSGQWGRMGRNQIEKCCEAKGLRKAWPDDLSNVYAEEEIDKAKFIDLDPSEVADLGAQQARLERVQSKDCVMISWTGAANEAPEEVPYGALPDRVFEFIERNTQEPQVISDWQIRNRHSIRAFWAARKTDALAIKRRIESVIGEAA